MGFRWLPALITGTRLSVEDVDKGGRRDVLSYDLAYLTTHDSFVAAYEDSLSMKKLIAKVAAGTSIAVEAKQGAALSPWYFRDPLDAEYDLSKSLYDRMAPRSSVGGSRGLRAALQSVEHQFRSSVAAAAAAAADTNVCDDETKQEATRNTVSAATAGMLADTTLHATILGSAALSATFLGSTLSSRKKTSPPATIALSAADWQAAIAHACTDAPGNETFADSTLTVLDILTYSR